MEIVEDWESAMEGGGGEGNRRGLGEWKGSRGGEGDQRGLGRWEGRRSGEGD